MRRVWYQSRLRLRSLFRRGRVEHELGEEFQFHFDQLVDEHIAAGMSPAQARRAAIRAMGSIQHFEEECRDMRRINYLDDLVRDLKYAIRNLRRSPGFAALAVLIMALGIGANTAVFSVVNGVLLKPLAYREPDRVVALTCPFTTPDTPAGLTTKPVSLPDFQDWHRQSSSFEAMAYYQSAELAIMAGSAAEFASASAVSEEFFNVFGVEPLVGRALAPEEWKAGAGSVMMSYAFWQSHFGGDPGAIGRQTIRFLGRVRPIAGVMPPGFGFPEKADLWYPLVGPAGSRGGHNYRAIARLKRDVPLERAQAEMRSIASHLELQYPETNKARTVAVTRMRDEMVGDIRLTLYLLLGAVSVVLLIACANTATLLLGKATSRAREVAVRIALGASQRRIARQLVTEALLLALLAGACGLLLAFVGSRLLVALAPSDLPRLGETGIDRGVLAFTFGLSLVTSLLFGLVPAVYASRTGLDAALRLAGTRSVTGGGLARTRAVLVTAEIALAVVLLAGAGLLMKSFVALHQVALGFRPENVLVMKATVLGPITVARQFFREVLPQISALPGVTAAGATKVRPGHIESMTPYFFDYLPPQQSWGNAPSAAITIVAPGTFRALGIPLKTGRDFNEGDTSDKPQVAVVNEAMVRKSFGGGDPIGRTIFCLYDSSQPMTVIGVAGDVRERGPAHEPIPECYLAYQQHAFGSLNAVVRTTGDPTAMEATVRRLVRARSPEVSVQFTTMEIDVSENVAAPRFRTLLLGVFAALAVCLAMAGVYGVMAYAVAQRANEIGLRMALGASRSSVLRLILGEGLAIAAVGLAMGLGAAVAATRVLTSMLFQVTPNDPLVYLGVAALLGAVTLIAGYLPARRAASIDPFWALRQD